MSARRLHLVRHPEPDIAEGICYGCSDIALREPWQSAIARVLPLLPAGATLFSSPLQRCLAFAGRLGPSVQSDARLAEIDFGRWEMQAWAAIPRGELDAWAAQTLSYAGHGGESVAQALRRVAQALNELTQTETVWVTHAGVMKLALAQLLDLPQSDWMALRFDYASVTSVEIAEGKARLLWHNSAHA